jgi:putative Holliday junction resolvase
VRILAVDWGERRIGLAVSDPTCVIASPLPTLTVSGRDDAVVRVAAAAAECEAERIVVGLPLTMAGERGEAALAAEAFAAALGIRTGLPFETWDERLTSALSVRRLHEQGVRTGHAKGAVDAGAAVALLESYLQRLAATRERLAAPGSPETSPGAPGSLPSSRLGSPPSPPPGSKRAPSPPEAADSDPPGQGS